MKRKIIKESELNEIIREINEVSGNPIQKFNNEGIRNIGNYHLGFGYGAYKLDKTLTTGGGIESVFGSGAYFTKRELYVKLNYFLNILYAKKES